MDAVLHSSNWVHSFPNTCRRLSGANVQPRSCRSVDVRMRADTSSSRGRAVMDSRLISVEWIGNSPDSSDALEITSQVDLPKRNANKIFFLDVHPLFYEGDKPRPSASLDWIRLLFLHVTHGDPVIAVMDGERGNEYRKSLLATYKEKRTKYKPLPAVPHRRCQSHDVDIREALPFIKAFLAQCNVPVVKVEDAEADDVVATLTQQALDRGLKVAIASPDMDFRQLLCENVQMVLPVPKLHRWSFYTLQQYLNQHEYDPSLELGLRAMMGDPSDNVPGLGQFNPQFGKKTAVKLMKHHGSLENLLEAATKRTVGKPYIQDTLKAHSAELRRNLRVLSLRRDVGVKLDDNWCFSRDTTNDRVALKSIREEFLQLRG